MIDASVILKRLDEERRSLAYDGQVIEILPTVTRSRAIDLTHHCVIYSHLRENDADAVILRQIETHRRLGVGFEWKLYAHDKPPDLQKRLESHGFAIGAREAVMALDLIDTQLDDIDTQSVACVDCVGQVVDFHMAAEDIFQKDYTFTAAELSAAIAAKSTQHRGYIAYAGREPASIGRLYTHPSSLFGGLYGGGTRLKFRGKGLYRAVVAARARDAIAHGARYLLVDALPTSQPILARLGFERLTDTWPCEWKPLAIK